MSQRTIQATATQVMTERLQTEQRVAVQELLRSLEIRINSYIEEWATVAANLKCDERATISDSGNRSKGFVGDNK